MDPRDDVRVKIVNKLIQGTLDGTFKWKHEIITLLSPLNTYYESRNLHIGLSSDPNRDTLEQRIRDGSTRLRQYEQDLFTTKVAGKQVHVISSNSRGYIRIDDFDLLKVTDDFLKEYITNPMITIMNVLHDVYAESTPTAVRLDTYLDLVSSAVKQGTPIHTRYEA